MEAVLCDGWESRPPPLLGWCDAKGQVILRGHPRCGSGLSPGGRDTRGLIRLGALHQILADLRIVSTFHFLDVTFARTRTPHHHRIH